MRNAENLGFAKANNQALQMVSTPFVCLLNSDTIVPEGLFKGLVQFLQGNPEAVACAPALRLPSGKLQVGGAGFRLTLTTAFNHFFFLSRVSPRFKGMYIYQDYFVRLGVPVQVDWLVGACFLVRASAIDRVGPLTEDYHMYAEDVEWCQRLSTVGNLYYIPSYEVIHFVGASSALNKTPSVTWLDSTFSLFEKNNSNMKLKFFQLIFLAGFGTRLIIYAIASLFNKNYAKNAREMLAYSLYSAKNMIGF